MNGGDTSGSVGRRERPGPDTTAAISSDATSRRSGRFSDKENKKEQEVIVWVWYFLRKVKEA